MISSALYRIRWEIRSQAERRSRPTRAQVVHKPPPNTRIDFWKIGTIVQLVARPPNIPPGRDVPFSTPDAVSRLVMRQSPA